MQIYDSVGLECRALGGLEISDYYRDDTILNWEVIFSSSRHKGDIGDFRTYLIFAQFGIIATITPLGVAEHIWYGDFLVTIVALR